MATRPRRRAKRGFAFKALGVGALGHRSAVAEIFGRSSRASCVVPVADDLSAKLPGSTGRSGSPPTGPSTCSCRRHRAAQDRARGGSAASTSSRARSSSGGRPRRLALRGLDGEVRCRQGVPRARSPFDAWAGRVLRRDRATGDRVRTATARTLTAVNLLAVDREAFEALSCPTAAAAPLLRAGYLPSSPSWSASRVLYLADDRKRASLDGFQPHPDARATRGHHRRGHGHVGALRAVHTCLRRTPRSCSTSSMSRSTCTRPSTTCGAASTGPSRRPPTSTAAVLTSTHTKPGRASLSWVVNVLGYIGDATVAASAGGHVIGD